MLHALRGGGPTNFFGGTQLAWLGDPLQLGPLGTSTPLLPPSETNASVAAPGQGDRGYGQWLFSQCEQEVYVLYDQHRIVDERYAEICHNMRTRWAQYEDPKMRTIAMQADADTLNTRVLQGTGARRTELLLEVRSNARAWHSGVGLSQTNDVASAMGEQRALAFAQAAGQHVIAYTAVDAEMRGAVTPAKAGSAVPGTKTRKRYTAFPLIGGDMKGLVDEVSRYNLRKAGYTPSTFYYIESSEDDEIDQRQPGLRYTIQVTGDQHGSKQYPMLQYCNRQVGRLVRLYLDQREGIDTDTLEESGVTHLKYPPLAAAFVPDVPAGAARPLPTLDLEALEAAGLKDFPLNAWPLCLSEVRFSFKAKSSGASILIQRANIRATPYTGITTHAAQGANTALTVVHFCMRMLVDLRDPALVLVALSRVKRLADLILLTSIDMKLLEWLTTTAKGTHRQQEWDRLVRAARTRKEAKGLVPSPREQREWDEVESRRSAK